MRLMGKLVRIEYEIPPMRAIYSEYYDELEGATDADYIAVFAPMHPRAKVRKIERNIPAREQAEVEGEEQ